MSEEYTRLDLGNEEAYIKTSRQDQLKKIDAAIFDCDGVLIDITDSYNRTISKTVAYVLEALIGRSIPDKLISDGVIFQFRRSGGFNNDWDTVYGILMFALCKLPERAIDEISGRIEGITHESDPFQRFLLVKEAQKTNSESEYLDEEFFRELIDGLGEFTEFLDATGVESVDENLSRTFKAGGRVDFLNVLKDFLRYKCGVGEGIIATVFEEFFCGSRLFLETYGIKPRFCDGLGFVENGQAIIRPEILDELFGIFGKRNLGIASGSKADLARYVLKDVTEQFKPESLIFLDNIEKTEREYSHKGIPKASLRKPNPFSLFKASEAFSPFRFAIYVGDSMEDVMMVKEAAKTDSRFLSAGVYRHSRPKNVIILDFLKSKCDMVLPSVNELPLVLKKMSVDES
jgi:phosphoglycolate phosphatase-like HAD superfamily hydrolase